MTREVARSSPQAAARHAVFGFRSSSHRSALGSRPYIGTGTAQQCRLGSTASQPVVSRAERRSRVAAGTAQIHRIEDCDWPSVVDNSCEKRASQEQAKAGIVVSFTTEPCTAGWPHGQRFADVSQPPRQRPQALGSLSASLRDLGLSCRHRCLQRRQAERPLAPGL